MIEPTVATSGGARIDGDDGAQPAGQGREAQANEDVSRLHVLVVTRRAECRMAGRVAHRQLFKGRGTPLLDFVEIDSHFYTSVCRACCPGRLPTDFFTVPHQLCE